MSEAEELVTYVFKWVTVVDARTCQKCLSLNGKEWRGQDLFQDEIWDEMYAGIWDLNANHSILHPNCRCLLEVTVEVHLEKIEVIEFTVGRQPTGRLTKLGELLRFRMLSADIQSLREQVSGLKRELSELKPSITEANRALTIYVALARRMGMPSDVVELLARVQQIRIATQMLTQAMQTLLVAAGPFGWGLGLGQLGLSAIMFTDQLTYGMRE